MPERHTGANLATQLNECVEEFQLKGHSAACVHDNACTRQPGASVSGRTYWLCLTLQLCIKAALVIDEVEQMVARWSLPALHYADSRDEIPLSHHGVAGPGAHSRCANALEFHPTDAAASRGASSSSD